MSDAHEVMATFLLVGLLLVLLELSIWSLFKVTKLTVLSAISELWSGYNYVRSLAGQV